MVVTTAQPLTAKAQPSVKLLPGQQIWQQGISSLLFGANDASWQWSAHHLGNTPTVAETVKTAGITVIRSPLQVGDADMRVAAIESTGAKCLGILRPQDAEQVVSTLGTRCNLYEFMNEPDNGILSVDAYSASWNQVIPRLRAINPQASFIGPVVASPNTAYIQRFLSLTKSAGNLPDAVSFHMYPCTDIPIANCSAHFADYGNATAKVRAVVNSVVGSDLPLGITEYNYSWKPGQTPNNDPFMQQFTAGSIQAMAQAGISLANQFDIANGAGNGTLDMIDPQTGQAKPQLQAIQALIQQYSQVQNTQPAGGNVPSASDPVQQPGTQAGNTPQTTTLLGAQQINCDGGNQSNAHSCTLIVQAKNTQTVVITWWNQDSAPISNLHISTSTDSTDGNNGTWQTTQMALTSSIDSGAQMLSIQPQTWVKAVVEPAPSNQTAVRGILQIYSITLSNVTPPNN
jgi:hypothetical protein